MSLCGNGLTLYQQSRVLKTLGKKPFENIVAKGENAGSIFSFAHNVFYPSKTKFQLLFVFNLSSANAFDLDQYNKE